MDYNEKKLEEIKKKEEEIIDLKKQDAKFDGCFRLEYADILRKKVSSLFHFRKKTKNYKIKITIFPGRCILCNRYIYEL